MNRQQLERSFGFLLHDVSRLYVKRFDQRLRRLGLTLTQCRALSYLIRHEGINQAGLAELIEVEPITCARLVDRMEEAGWLVRRPDPTDRRARLLFLTDKAKPIYAEIAALSGEVRDEALAGLSPARREVMIDMLRHLHANLSAPRELPDAAVPATRAAS